MNVGTEIARFLDGEHPEASLGLRFLTGALLGAVFAIFTPLLALLWFVSGPEVMTRKSILVRVDLLTALYPLGAVITGALFAALVSYARSRVTASLLGVAAFIPWCAAIGLCIDRGYADWSAKHTFLTLFCAVVFGGFAGWFTAHARLHK
jgi:hypothetical protein